MKRWEGKVIGIGSNHPGPENAASESLPSFFLKASSSLAWSGEEIPVPPLFDSVFLEAELGVVIGRECSKVSEEDVGAYIRSWVVINDLTGHSHQSLSIPLALKKGCNGFLAVSKEAVPFKGFGSFNIHTKVDGQLVQSFSTAIYRYDVQRVVSYLSQYVTLFPGDLICMGCKEPRTLVQRDVDVEVHIESIGVLKNRICFQKK
jgi:2-keto-4-pentenoate hydratase/2-oxohepta-3-ene-1,7-dioic acid hydratase in catechol pathway